MELHLFSRNLEIPEGLRTYLERKVRRLVRKYPFIRRVRVELASEGTRSAQHRMVAEVTLTCNGTLVRGEERAATLPAAVDMAVDTLDRRLLRWKGRLYREERERRVARLANLRAQETPPGPGPEPVELPTGRHLVRVKRFPMKPMTVEDAALQMELLGHDFFLFLDASDGTYRLLYRREDGDYGLILPAPG